MHVAIRLLGTMSEMENLTLENKNVVAYPGSTSLRVGGTTPNPSQAIVLRTAGLEMSYQMGTITVPALRGVDLEIYRGEFVSIMGSSGSGKSTLLHLIGGLLTPTKGRVFVAEQELTPMSDAERTELRRREIGFVFQRFNLFPTLSVDDNIRLAERIHAGSSPRHPGNPSRRRELLSLLGLESKSRHKPKELSGGEQQRVALARAIINEPSILLADEPTGNLDSANSETVLEMLQKLNREMAQTIVMITHDREAADYSTRTISMKDGRVIMDTSRLHTWDTDLPRQRLKLG
jgi:putative ABC transport system ATP-binding protein